MRRVRGLPFVRSFRIGSDLGCSNQTPRLVLKRGESKRIYHGFLVTLFSCATLGFRGSFLQRILLITWRIGIRLIVGGRSRTNQSHGERGKNMIFSPQRHGEHRGGKRNFFYRGLRPIDADFRDCLNRRAPRERRRGEEGLLTLAGQSAERWALSLSPQRHHRVCGTGREHRGGKRNSLTAD